MWLCVKAQMSECWGGSYIGTAHVTSGADDSNANAEPSAPPTGAQRYCSRISGSSLMPGKYSKAEVLKLWVATHWWVVS